MLMNWTWLLMKKMKWYYRLGKITLIKSSECWLWIIIFLRSAVPSQCVKGESTVSQGVTHLGPISILTSSELCTGYADGIYHALGLQIFCAWLAQHTFSKHSASISRDVLQMFCKSSANSHILNFCLTGQPTPQTESEPGSDPEGSSTEPDQSTTIWESP